MPAFNYFPQYQPYQQGYLPPQYQMPAVQPQQQQQTSIIWVSGPQEAQSYPVAPNNAVALWDSSGSVIYLKQADASGKPTIKAYDLVERTQGVSPGAPASEDKLAALATKTELEALSAALEAVKGDVTKLRKALRRKEADDDDE